jgi:tRNA (mo5U34)-methyltransferase
LTKLSRLASKIRPHVVGRRAAPIPLSGHPPLGRAPAEVDRWTDEQLERLNALLPWNCFTVDSRGRRVGGAAWAGKRVDPQAIPDPRIARLHDLVDLTARTVLEVGCFEGVHTVALCDLAGSVVAIDSRVENVVKTLVRTALYGHRPAVHLLDVERPADAPDLRNDVLHHCGVLYHLKDPVSHLRAVLPHTAHAVLLDTHYARDEEAVSTYTVGEDDFLVKDYAEGGIAMPFAGMYDMARWLRLDDLVRELARAGFDDLLVKEPREERNGARVLLIARRSAEGR